MTRWNRCSDDMRNIWEGIMCLVSTLAGDIYFSNDVVLERCALSAMNREPWTLDDAMFNSYEKSLSLPGQLLSM